MQRRVTLIILLSLSILVPLMGQTCAILVPLPGLGDPAAQPLPGPEGPAGQQGQMGAMGNPGPAGQQGQQGPAGPQGTASPTTVETLALVRGHVDETGQVVSGAGFTATLNATGDYVLTFNPPFAAEPSLTATALANVGPFVVTVVPISPSVWMVRTWDATLSMPTLAAVEFYFTAIGPR